MCLFVLVLNACLASNITVAVHLECDLLQLGIIYPIASMLPLAKSISHRVKRKKGYIEHIAHVWAERSMDNTM